MPDGARRWSITTTTAGSTSSPSTATPTTSTSRKSTLAHNKGNGTFEDVSSTSGPYFQEKYVSRGLTYGDYDNDGDIDFLVINLNDSPKLLRNDGGNKNNWLAIEPLLKFPTGTRTAVGARVTVTVNGMKMIDDVNPVRGYLSTQDPRLFFGLGKATQADSVEIRWPDGEDGDVHEREGQAVREVRSRGQGDRAPHGGRRAEASDAPLPSGVRPAPADLRRCGAADDRRAGGEEAGLRRRPGLRQLPREPVDRATSTASG